MKSRHHLPFHYGEYCIFIPPRPCPLDLPPRPCPASAERINYSYQGKIYLALKNCAKPTIPC